MQAGSHSAAFAAILGDGSFVTWCHERRGGDSISAQDQLKNAQKIHASDDVFAVILGHGCVATWGSAFRGGDSSFLKDQPKKA